MPNYSRFYAIRGSRYYDLTGGVAWLDADDGFGLPPIERITERGPLQNGVTDLGFRLSPRNITLSLAIPEGTRYTNRAIRQAFLEAFKPSNSPVKLRWEYEDGSQRQIDTFVTGGLTLPLTSAERVNCRIAQTDTVTLYAPDPTWYAPSTQTVSTTGVAQSGLIFAYENDFEGIDFPIDFPVTFDGQPDTTGWGVFPIVFGDQILSQVLSITYGGTWLSYPTIEIVGPIDWPRVQNLSTGEEIWIQTGIPSGFSAVIDLSYGAKTVRRNDGLNLLPFLSSESDLANFHIAADPEVAGGLNQIQCSGSSVFTLLTRITIHYNERFIGV